MGLVIFISGLLILLPLTITSKAVMVILIPSKAVLAPKSARRKPNQSACRNHRNSEIPGKHALISTLVEGCRCAPAVQAPVGHLEVLRSAPRMNDQNPYPRLNRAPC